MLTLDHRLLEDLLCDPRMAAGVLMGWEMDDFQAAGLKLDWWFPWTIDSSGTGTGKTVRMFLLSCLRAMLMEDHVVGCYFPTWAAIGQNEFWPYFYKTMGQSELFRSQLKMHRRKLGETKGPSSWTMNFENGSKIEMPAPNFLRDAMTQAGRSFNTLIVDEWLKTMEMGEGLNAQLIERARRPSPNKHCPVRANHVHLKGHAQRPSHKGYSRYKAFRDLIKGGSQRHAVYTFCYKDISPKWAFLRQDEIIRTQKASLSRDEFSRQILGLWTRDGSTFYPEALLARGAQDMACELERTHGEHVYFLGFDLAPGQSMKADWCAAKVLRLRPVAVEELPRLMEAGCTRFFRTRNQAWEMSWVYAWMGRGLSAGELAGFIHWLDARFRFALIGMDPGGGGQWVRAELLKPEAEWGGATRRVMPICTRLEPSLHEKRPILHLFRRGGEFDALPFVGPEMTTGDDGFLAAWHGRYRERWERGEIGYPLPLALRPAGTEKQWSGDLLLAQKTMDHALLQLEKVRQQTDDEGRPLISKRGFPLFHSSGKKDLAYAGLYGFAAAELWLEQNFGGEDGEESEGMYT